MTKQIQSGIYCITNTANGKRYVGSAVNVQHRILKHLNLLGKGEHFNHHLQNAYNLYGQEAFTASILEVCGKEKLIEREQYYFDRLNPEYNLLKKAGSQLGYRWTGEQKAQLSAVRRGSGNSMFGKIHSDAAKQKVSKANKGRKRSAETKRKLSAVHKGKKRSIEFIAKLTARMRGENNPMRGKKRSEEAKAKTGATMRAWWAKHKESLSGKNSHWFGKKHSEETKSKIGKAQAGEKHWAFGKKSSEETVAKMRAGAKKAWKKRKESIEH